MSLRLPARRAVLVGAATLTLGRASDAAGLARVPLFRIARSKNANVVQYEAVLAKGGGGATELDPRTPVVASWILLAEDGRREPLSGLEERAYGFRVVREKGGGCLLQLRAVKDRSLRVLHWGDRWVAQVLVAGRSAVLGRIFVQTDESAFVPSVRWVDVHGTDMTTGKPLVERLKP